jgi:hypothetical protein
MNFCCVLQSTTAKIFHTAYKVAKSIQSFNNFEMAIELQELNGVDMGRTLHSTNVCFNVINHINKEMKNNLVHKILSSNSRMSLITDEATTLSKKSTLILYIPVLISGFEMTVPVNLLFDLIELDDATATGIFSSFICHLQSIGMTEEYLNDHLVSVACDGAAVMFGSHSGVKKLLKEKYPSTILLHCASHRLELAIHDAVKTVSGINRFK